MPSVPSTGLSLGTRLVAVLLTIFSSLALTNVPDEAAAGEPAPLRVMVAGDSISQEFAGDYTWRRRLWQEFQRQGVSAQFVGPRNTTFGPTPLAPGPWQARRHDSLAGARLAGQRDRIGGDVSSYHPDVVLVMLGFNDLFHGATSTQVVENMEQYVDHIWEAKRDVRVVLSPILDTIVYPTGAPRVLPVKATNDGYAELVSRLAGEGRPITLASTASRWVPRAHTTDGIHPNPTGETVIAQRYAATLHELGVLPQAPALSGGYVPWVTNARATVRRVRGHTMRFSWTSLRTRLSMPQGLLRIQGRRLGQPLVLRSAPGVSTRSRKLRRGHYTVRLAPVRKWLQGAYGPPVRFVVR